MKGPKISVKDGEMRECVERRHRTGWYRSWKREIEEGRAEQKWPHVSRVGPKCTRQLCVTMTEYLRKITQEWKVF